MENENILLNPIDIIEDVIHQKKNGILVELLTMNWLLR
jgi:hypothetical protein